MDNQERDITSPLSYFEQLSDNFDEKASGLFDSLVADSGIDVEANRSLVSALEKDIAESDALRDELSKKKRRRILLVTGIVLGALFVFFGIFSVFYFDLVVFGAILASCGAVLIAVCAVFYARLGLTSAIRFLREEIHRHESAQTKLTDEAREQMSPLNELFSDDDNLSLIKKSLSGFEFDERFTFENQRLLTEDGYVDVISDGSSVFDTISGRLYGNPFLVLRSLHHYMGKKTYTGSISISWTEEETDQDGETTVVCKSEVLSASVTEPYPVFYTDIKLYYGCKTAPGLSFSRSAQHSELLSENALRNRIRSGEKKLLKKSRRSVATGSAYQNLGNTEFEVLFGAQDRDDEVQFRLLFTPLAQRNMVELLTSKRGYGDDFSFKKCKCMNIISAEHVDTMGIRLNADRYRSFDYEKTKREFLRLNNQYFKSFYFLFAPLLCIPSYLTEDKISPGPAKEPVSHFTSYEHEAIVNAMGDEFFAPDGSSTQCLLKTFFLNKQSDCDILKVTAHSYRAEQRTSYISELGGDGEEHDVPVDWVEYVPLSAEKKVKVCPAECARNDPSMRNAFHFHGMACSLCE